MLDYYPEFSPMSRAGRQFGEVAEAQAIKHCQLCVYSSDWAAETAVANYGADREKILVAPFGANVSKLPDRSSFERSLAQRSTKKFRVLLVGVNWQRKGGDLAAQAVAQLRREGIDISLSVVGAPPSDAALVTDVISYEGWIDKNDPSGDATLGRLLAQSHVLLLPTRAECFGVVFAEAAAFGVPSVATKTGGVTTAVQDGKTGLLMDMDAGAEQYAAALRRLLTDRAAYETYARAAYDDYQKRLSWSVNGAVLRERMCALIRGDRNQAA
ncbi:MAG: glycosyltransferase family 4 protein [Pseudomonadota bacterium]